MGWWHYGVMDGDTPCDVEMLLQETVLRRQMDDSSDASVLQYRKDFDHELIHNNAAAIAAIRAAEHTILDRLATNCHLFWQVVAFVCMRVGAPIDTFRDDALVGAKADEWASRSDKRKAAMYEFYRQVETYNPGQPVTTFHEMSLADAFREQRQTNGSGLINK